LKLNNNHSYLPRAKNRAEMTLCMTDARVTTVGHDLEQTDGSAAWPSKSRIAE